MKKRMTMHNRQKLNAKKFLLDFVEIFYCETPNFAYVLNKFLEPTSTEQ